MVLSLDHTTKDICLISSLITCQLYFEAISINVTLKKLVSSETVQKTHRGRIGFWMILVYLGSTATPHHPEFQWQMKVVRRHPGGGWNLLG